MNRIQTWIGLGLFLLSLVVFSLTLYPWAFPGASAKLLAAHAGIDPFARYDLPLWGLVVSLLSHVPISTLAVRANTFSALCSAGSVWLLFDILTRIRHNRTAEESRIQSTHRDHASLVSGIFGALFLIISTPFWFAATRAYPVTLGIFLLLLSVKLVLTAFQNDHMGFAFGAALVCGLGMAEFPTMIVITPLVGVGILLFQYLNRRLTLTNLLLLALLFLAGLSVSVLSVSRFCRAPSFEWLLFDDFPHVFKVFWRDQFFALKGSMPRTGWIIIGSVTVVPWIVTFMLPRKLGKTFGARMGSYTLRLAITGVGALVLLNHRISPWDLLGAHLVLLTPYVLTAMWMGYLAGYWYVLFYGIDERGGHGLLQRAMQVVLPLAAIGLLGVAAVQNLGEILPGRAAFTRAFTQTALDEMQGRDWLVSDHPLNAVLRIEAHERKQPLRIADPTKRLTGPTLNYLADQLNLPQLKPLHKVGFEAAFKTWLDKDPKAALGMGLFELPERFSRNGYRATPSVVLFTGTDPDEPVPTADLFKRHQAFWPQVPKDVLEATPRTSIIVPIENRAREAVGKIANNLGILLEDAGEDEDAYTCYEQAGLVDEDNLSALINKVNLAARLKRPNTATMAARLKDTLKAAGSTSNPMALVPKYGGIRNPRVFHTLGWSWAVAGQPHFAIQEFQRAITLDGKGGSELRSGLAALYATTDQPDKADSVYRQMLEENPADAKALGGLMQMAMQKGDFKEAADLLRRLEAAGAPKDIVLFEAAKIATLKGNLESARTTLERLLEKVPDNLGYLSHHAIICMAMGDTEAGDKTLELLLKNRSKQPTLLNLIGQMLIFRSRLDEAYGVLEKALVGNTQPEATLETLLRLDLALNRKDKARNHTKRLLSYNPNNPWGHFVLASIQFYEGNLDLAEQSLRTCIAQRKIPDALNDLAWILYKKGELEEAFTIAEEAVLLSKGNPGILDTYGQILFKLDRHDEAERAFKAAMGIQPKQPAYAYHLAKLYASQRKIEEAIAVLEPYIKDPDTWDSPADFKVAESFFREL